MWLLVLCLQRINIFESIKKCVLNAFCGFAAATVQFIPTHIHIHTFFVMFAKAVNIYHFVFM